MVRPACAVLALCASLLAGAAHVGVASADVGVASVHKINVTVHATEPFEGQKPGTSGLRVRTRKAMQPGFVRNYVQAVLDALE